jgi:hypothetical protein
MPCTVYPNTDENGNPLNAWVITYDNKGPYNDALAGVSLNFYDASGTAVGEGGYNSPVPFSLCDGELNSMEIPAGLSTIGTNPPSEPRRRLQRGPI